jgi:catechol 2,3-dioxygenase-like lactoylglutathione lyase family enzyme
VALLGIDHVQLAGPPGCEADARRFYAELLGLEEIPKPAAMLASGGIWFRIGDQELHIGIQDPLRHTRPILGCGFASP